MPNIPSLPERGQPLDVSYIYKIVEALTEINNAITVSTGKTITIDTVVSGPQSGKTSDAKIIGGYKQIVDATAVTVGEEKSFDYAFSDYKYPPIVTATAVNISGSDAGKNVSIVLKPVTTNKVEGVIRFNSAGNATVGINLLIIGIPN